MSDVALCPTCNSKAKIKRNGELKEFIYTAIQDKEAFIKIAQMRKALLKTIKNNKALKEEIKTLKGD